MNYIVYCNIKGKSRPACAAEKNSEIDAQNAFEDIVNRIRMAKALGGDGDRLLRRCTRVYLQYGDEILFEENVDEEEPEESE